MSLMSWFVVIPKEGRALGRIRPSFGMTPTFLDFFFLEKKLFFFFEKSESYQQKGHSCTLGTFSRNAAHMTTSHVLDVLQCGTIEIFTSFFNDCWWVLMCQWITMAATKFNSHTHVPILPICQPRHCLWGLHWRHWGVNLNLFSF